MGDELDQLVDRSASEELTAESSFPKLEFTKIMADELVDRSGKAHMETLEQVSVDRSAKKAQISFPDEIIEDIFSRLPIKSILRFRSISKLWLDRISFPSFTKLHFSRSTRTALFISAYDSSTRKRHFISGPHDGGPVTHLITLADTYSSCLTQAARLNGLVCFTCVKSLSDCNHAHAYVLNPSTRKILKIPKPTRLTKRLNRLVRICYLFGFDESRNEHKILMIRMLGYTPEIMIFCMSNHSWRKINVEPFVGFTWDQLCFDYYDLGVCVSSAVHVMVNDSFDILVFDFRTEKFSIINTPHGVAPHELETVHNWNGRNVTSVNRPCIIKINGCIGVACVEHMMEHNEMHVWILQNYDNRVWVREIITLPASWIKIAGSISFPFEVNMDEIIFFSKSLSRNDVISVVVYNKKSGCFKSLEFTSGLQFMCSKTVRFDQIRCYVESMLPL